MFSNSKTELVMPQATVTEILDRMRQHAQEHGGLSSGSQLRARERFLGSDDTRRLHHELMAVHALHAAVGEINPRPPGLHNQAIQFMKKVMRRVLTWYTRPLHQFHAAVSRALQEQGRLVSEHAAAIKDLRGALEALNRVRAIELAREQQAVENFLNSNIEERLAGLENRVQDLLPAKESMDSRSQTSR
jgi:hypothetical protein